MNKTALFLCLVLLAGCSQRQAGTEFSTDNKKVSVYTTADKTAFRLTGEGSSEFMPFGQPQETDPCIFVDPGITFQTFVGIGGALTDASAETFAKLPEEKQREVLTAYYDREKGIGYTLARTPINSSDFSSGSYTYADEGDAALRSFSVARDLKYRIPFIKKAIEAAGGALTMFVSPWSPPAWMKDNNDMLHGGKLKKEFYQSWADYYVKFIQAYEKEGVPVWGLTVQNEPMATQKWESCIYTAEEERDFIKNYLGPTLRQNGMSSKKLIGWDHNRDLLFQRADTLLSDPDAAKYIWGIGYHWYERWHGDSIFENVKRVQEAYPGTNLMLTEACNYPFSWTAMKDWNWGELYGKSIINDLNNGSVAWTDWNVLLDETGGPNHVQNFCFAPMHGDTRKGTLHYMNSYYYIGHFSKFIRPGARRVASSSSRAQLLTTAFLNRDGSLAVVVMNQSKDRIPYRLWIAGKAVDVDGLPHSISTLLVK
ncbi:MAG: glycoside hydrolase family 30 protein [Elusimicrobia bacterium]|nr:glycoside hydrolase family 30 protein [Elusimicrobiota bacterium]